MFGGWRAGSPWLYPGTCAMGQETRSKWWVRAGLRSYQFIPHPKARPGQSCPSPALRTLVGRVQGSSTDGTGGDSGVVPGHPPQLLTRRCRAAGGAADLHPTGWGGENPGSAAQALIKSQSNNKPPE